MGKDKDPRLGEHMHKTGQLTFEQFDIDFAYRRISDEDKIQKGYN